MKTLSRDRQCAVKENFKADYIIDVLQGRETSEVQAHLHEDLEVFGSGMGEEDKTWNAVIRQALIAGYLSKDVENYGLLKVTDAGKKFLKHPKSFKITEDNDFEEVEEETPARGGGSCAVDPVLYSMLKDLRKKLSKKLEVPPYVIFQDPSLEAMATIYPVTLEELQNIPGVGAGKAKRYGEEFCKLIKRHCEENEIERPEDLRVRTVANKSKMKVAIIQAIDRKVALDDIALSKGIEFSELLDEVEAIVYSGTKLNIDSSWMRLWTKTTCSTSMIISRSRQQIRLTMRSTNSVTNLPKKKFVWFVSSLSPKWLIKKSEKNCVHLCSLE